MIALMEPDAVIHSIQVGQFATLGAWRDFTKCHPELLL